MNFQAIKLAVLEWIDRQAIPDWGQAWKLLSVKFNALLVAFGGVWILLPDDAKGQILTAVGVPTAWVVVAIGVVGFVLRLKSQQPKEPE
jgi:hypothetical protein